MFKEVDFLEHFKGTGKTEAEIKELVDGYTVRLTENKQGEAVERSIIDELTSELGTIFAKDIAAIDKRIVNSTFEAQRVRARIKRTAALQKVFETARQDFDNAQRPGADKAADDAHTEAINVSDADAAITAAKEEIAAADREIAAQRKLIQEKQAAIDALLDGNGEFNENSDAYKAATELDKKNYYISQYGKEYIESRGLFERLRRGLKVGADGKVDLSKVKDEAALAADIERYVMEQMKTEDATKSDDNLIVINDNVAKKTPAYKPFNPAVYDANLEHPDNRATLRLSIDLMRSEIERARERITTAEATKAASGVKETDQAAIKAAAEKHHADCLAEVAKFNALLTDYNKNVAAARQNRLAAGVEISPLEYTRAERLRIAQDILENEIDESNPLLQLAYEGYIANIREQDRIAAKFKSDASEELEAILQNDFESNDAAYMENALEHYIAEGYGSGRYVADLTKLRSNVNKYFGKYVPDLAKRYDLIRARYTTAANSFDYFTREVLAVDYVGKNRTDEYNESINEALDEYRKAIDKRVASQRNRLELLNPDYDRVSRYSKNPTVKDYMALTMLRETLLAEKREAEAKQEPFLKEGMLAEVSRQMVDSIEVAKRNGTIIDIANATQIATETLIPGYDEIYEFAKIRDIDLTTKEGRDELALLQEEFIAQNVIAQANVNEVAMIVDFLNKGKTPLQGAEREQFIAEHMAEIADHLQSTQPRLHPTLGGFRKEIDLTNEHTLDLSLKELQKHPDRIVTMFKSYGQAGIDVIQENGVLKIATPGQPYVEVAPENLINKEFLVSAGMMLELPSESAKQNSEAAKNTPKISDFLVAREKMCCVKSKGGKDLGIFGQASIYVAQEADFDLAKARTELRAIYADPKTLAEFKKANPNVADPKAELRRQYQLAYCDLMDKYGEKKQEIAEMMENGEMAVPAEHRENNSPLKKDHSEIYDEAGIHADKKTQYRGGVARTNAMVKKVQAIQDARFEFQNADEAAIELLNEGIATAVVDMLQTLEETRIANENYLAILNAAISKGLENRVEREDEIEVKMDEETKKLSLNVGERTFSVADDGKVVISQREAAQTVGDTGPSQN